MVKLCNKKNCQSICHINAAKKPFAKCLKHLNDGKRLSEQKFRKRLETLDESGVLSKARGLKVKGLTALRMRKLRSDRKAVIFSIESENIRRLATKLNLVRGGLRYVVIQDAIPQSEKKTVFAFARHNCKYAVPKRTNQFFCAGEGDFQ